MKSIIREKASRAVPRHTIVGVQSRHARSSSRLRGFFSPSHSLAEGWRGEGRARERLRLEYLGAGVMLLVSCGVQRRLLKGFRLPERSV